MCVCGVVALFCRVCVCTSCVWLVGCVCENVKSIVVVSADQPALLPRAISAPNGAYKLYNTHTHVNSAGLHPSVGITINTPLSVGQSYPPKPGDEPEGMEI